MANEKPQEEVKKLSRELKQTKEALSDMAVRAMVLENMLAIYAESHGEDPEEVKKNSLRYCTSNGRNRSTVISGNGSTSV